MIHSIYLNLFSFTFLLTFVLQSSRSFIWVSWRYLASTDSSCKPQFRPFVPSFLCCYLFSKWNLYFFILVFSDPFLFCLFDFLSFTFPPLSLFAYPLLSLSPSVSIFVCLLLSVLLSSILLLWLSLFILDFLFLFLSVSLSVFFFLSSALSLSSIIFPFFFSLSFRVYFIIIILPSFFFVFSTFQFLVYLFCVFFSICLSLFFLRCSFFFSL